MCEERGIDARANGAPVVRDEPGTEKTLERIRKLLALAGSSNQHEAEAAMKKAHELMLRHNIEQLPIAHEFEVRHLGEPRAPRERRRGRGRRDPVASCSSSR